MGEKQISLASGRSMIVRTCICFLPVSAVLTRRITAVPKADHVRSHPEQQSKEITSTSRAVAVKSLPPLVSSRSQANVNFA